MTLDEAILHAEEVADVCEYEAGKYDMSDSYERHVACQEGECANEHRQLAEWLKNYKRMIEQEPCEDVVSRELVRKEFCNWVMCKKTPNDFLYVLGGLPSVQPMRKRGKWITTRTFQHDGEFYCNKCKCDSPKNEKWDYCPNCGAKMV